MPLGWWQGRQERQGAVQGRTYLPGESSQGIVGVLRQRLFGPCLSCTSDLFLHRVPPEACRLGAPPASVSSRAARGCRGASGGGQGQGEAGEAADVWTLPPGLPTLAAPRSALLVRHQSCPRLSSPCLPRPAAPQHDSRRAPRWPGCQAGRAL